jgi:hypothetical protein
MNSIELVKYIEEHCTSDTEVKMFDKHTGKMLCVVPLITDELKDGRVERCITFFESLRGDYND